MKTKFLLIIAIQVLLAGSLLAQDVEKYSFIRHDSIPMPKSYYKALTPAYPLMRAYINPWKLRPEEREKLKCFDYTKGMIQHCIVYKTVVNGDTVLIDTHEKFREIFAPVESEQEAIAFAYIFTDSKPMYNLDFLEKYIKPQYHYYEFVDIKETRLKNGKKQMDAIVTRDSMRIIQPIDKGWSVYQPEIISSYVKKTDYGYELLLYHYVVFGGSHPYMRRLIKVSFAGEVSILEECAAFAERSEYGLHVD